MTNTLQEKNEDRPRTAGIMGKTRRNIVKEHNEKGQERPEDTGNNIRKKGQETEEDRTRQL